MSEKINEQLSAWVDGEIDAAEEALLVRRVQQDVKLAVRWQRYHMIGDAVRGQLPESMDYSLADRVAASIEEEETYHLTPSRARQPAHWSRPFVGAAIAASVAVVAVLAVRQADLPDDELQVAETAMPSADEYKRLDPTRLAESQPQVVDQLNPYLVNHNEFAARNGRLGLSPQVRIVGYEQSLQEQ
jgi:sigma-E factor negative regulatory protein RseA